MRKAIRDYVIKLGNSDKDMLLILLLLDYAVCAIGLGLATGSAIIGDLVLGGNYVASLVIAILIGALAGMGLGALFDKLGFEKLMCNAVILSLLGCVTLLLMWAGVGRLLALILDFAGVFACEEIFDHCISQRLDLHEQAKRNQALVKVGALAVFAIGFVTGLIWAAKHRSAPVIAAIVIILILYLLLEITQALVREAHYDLSTEWEADDWTVYPRPQMRRDSYLNLNGSWQLNGRDIRVPYPPESKLSGYGGPVGGRMVYMRQIEIPDDFMKKADDRILLHFGAVDQIADVYVDGHHACHHEGGYLPFEADVTDLLAGGCAGLHELTVKAVDRLDKKYPYGKQAKRRGGMWYTPVSGIWQTVWMEAVPKTYIKDLKITPDADRHVRIEAEISQVAVGASYRLDIDCEGTKREQVSKAPVFDVDMAALTTPRLWSPEDPYLYEFTLMVENGGETVDAVTSYFALRTIEIKRVGSYNRIFLNDKPVFLNGLLDQGYYPDGIFLPADADGYRFDIQAMKDLGFNMLRKHIKVEPEQFYYDCDRLGMLVMQDMVNSGRYSFFWETALPTVGLLKRDDKKRIYAGERKAFFERHSAELIRTLYNHPCIVAYTVFNEGWGQYDSDRITAELKAIDPTRLYDSTSGWFAQSGSDFDSRHLYFDQTPITAGDKTMIISECGGFSRQMEGHIFSKYAEYGYGGCADEAALTRRTREMYERLVIPSIATGLCGCVYTQVSDVEDETNGIYTYDRKACKLTPADIREINDTIYSEYAKATKA